MYSTSSAELIPTLVLCLLLFVMPERYVGDNDGRLILDILLLDLFLPWSLCIV